MADNVTRWIVEHSEKERLVDLEVIEIRSKIKHIENLLKENYPQWQVVQRCMKLKDKVDSFEKLSQDLTSKSNEINTSLELTLHDPQADEGRKARCKQLSDILLAIVTKQSELGILIAELTCIFIEKIPDTSNGSDPSSAPTQA